MTSTNQQPVSKILKSKLDVKEEPKKRSREDWRKAKELDEARKAGTEPAAVDEEGKDINPHIPQYISNAPWYYGTSGPTLKHQRPQKDPAFSNIFECYRRGVDFSKVSVKYRQGACENCGALTHKKKECFNRPKKTSIKYCAGVKMAPDEFKQSSNLVFSYDGKRDRWNGYDSSEYKAIINEFQKVEEAKLQLKSAKLAADGVEEDEDKYVDEVDMPGTKVDSKQRITVRNLRIREDTAKYLRNLDPNSAYYDPKTRSMRENSNPTKENSYAGENFVKFTGDTTKHAKAQLFAWEAHERGVDVHLLAEPTKLEMLQKEYAKNKGYFDTRIHTDVLKKYGGEEHLKAPPKNLLLAQTEDYVEYARTGEIIKGLLKKNVQSRYPEDVYVNNHTSVWGSFWKGGLWGYQCCHSFLKNSYCVRTDKASPIRMGGEKVDTPINLVEGKPELTKNTKDNIDERKRPYNSLCDNKKPTKEEMEAFFLKRKRWEDPINVWK